MATHGADAQLYISDGPSASAPVSEGDWIEIDLAREGTLNRQKDEAETSARNSKKNRQYLPGWRSGTYDVTVIFQADDPGVAELITSYYADGESGMRWFRDRPEGTGSGLPESVFQGFVTNMPASIPRDDVVTMQVTIRISGEITTSVQSS